MLTLTAGQEATIVVPFTRDDEPFVPDTGSATWSLRGQDGALVTGYVDQSLTTITDTFARVTIPAAANVIGASSFEKRFVVVKGLIDGSTFEVRVAYRLSPWTNMTATPDDVRAFCGTDAGELPDHEIDLVSAYFLQSDLYGSTLFKAALASGLAAETLANRTIVARAVLLALPGLRQRMLKRQSDGIQQAERFPIDYDALALAAGAIITEGEIIIGALDDTISTWPIFLVATPSPDPVTGE